MDAATLQSRIYKGYGKAAVRLGLANNVYRPAGTANPLAAGNLLVSLLASFNSEDWSYLKPNKYGRPTWYGLFDGSLTRAGDYLVGPKGTFFIAAQQLHLSILCVECNRSVALVRAPAASSPTGVQAYGGACATEDTAALGTLNGDGTLSAGWPASILLAGKSEQGVGLPMSVKNAGFQILLPASIPLVINASDTFLDDLGRRYVAEACELTDLGWRINAKEAHP